MLLQSHNGEIHLLPALPDAWSEGKEKGLVARGGIVVNMEWKEGKLVSAEFLTKFKSKVNVRYNKELVELNLQPETILRIDGNLN